MEKNNIDIKQIVLVQTTFKETIKFLMENSNLKKEVIEHCKKGLIVIDIIYSHLAYNTPTDDILTKEFDEFFERFPREPIEKRELIPITLIAKSIEMSISMNAVMNSGR